MNPPKKPRDVSGGVIATVPGPLGCCSLAAPGLEQGPRCRVRSAGQSLLGLGPGRAPRCADGQARRQEPPRARAGEFAARKGGSAQQGSCGRGNGTFWRFIAHGQTSRAATDAVKKKPDSPISTY